MRRAAVLGLLLACAAARGAQQPAGPSVHASGQGAATIELEVVVLDAKEQPVTDLRAEEVDVVQDAKRQPLHSFEAASIPGHYLIRYSPLSGKPNSVAVRVLRKGTKVRGPRGGFLEPRVVRGLSALEAELTSVMESRPQANELACQVRVLRFERGPNGLRHAFAAEIPLSSLRFERAVGGLHGRVQVLARIKGEQRPVRLLTLDRIVEAASRQEVLLDRLMWTSSIPLAAGHYDFHVLVRDPGAERSTVRSLALDVPVAREGLEISSVTLLQPRGGFFITEERADDALVFGGVALMPKLAVALEQGAENHVRFFVILYPDAPALSHHLRTRPAAARARSGCGRPSRAGCGPRARPPRSTSRRT